MPPRAAETTRPRILLIEDEPSVAAFLRTALERRGYEVVDSPSALEGLQRLGAEDFRGVISDFARPAESTAQMYRIGSDGTNLSWLPESCSSPATRQAAKPPRCWRRRERRTWKNRSASISLWPRSSRQSANHER